MILNEKAKKRLDPLAKKFGLDFKIGKDQDYLGAGLIITFDEDEKENYTIKGFTGGLATHACKHLSQFDRDYLSAVIDKFKKSIIEYIKKHKGEDIVVQYFASKLDGAKEESDINKQVEMVEKAPDMMFLNYLDLINDKIILKERLTEIEKLGIPYLENISKKYAEIIKRYIKESIKIENDASREDVDRIIDTKDNFNFEVIYDNEPATTVYIINKTIMLMTRKGAAVTLFEKRNLGQIMIGLFRRYTFMNKNVKRSLLTIC